MVIIYLTQMLVAEKIILQQSKTVDCDKSSILRQVDNHLRELVDSLLTPADEAAEDEFERELAAEGFIGEVQPLTATDEEIRQYRAYQPITVEGQPL